MLSRTTHTGVTGTQQYAISFAYLKQAYIHVYVNDVETTNFTITSNGLDVVIVTPSITNGDDIQIHRLTLPKDVNRLVDWVSGSSVTEEDLDTMALQLLHLVQERKDLTDLSEPHVADDTIHVPAGGAQDEVLAKLSAASGDTGWAGGMIFSLPTPPDGCILTFDTAGNPYVLEPGTAGQRLTTNGPGALPTWETP